MSSGYPAFTTSQVVTLLSLAVAPISHLFSSRRGSNAGGGSTASGMTSSASRSGTATPPDPISDLDERIAAAVAAVVEDTSFQSRYRRSHHPRLVLYLAARKAFTSAERSRITEALFAPQPLADGAAGAGSLKAQEQATEAAAAAALNNTHGSIHNFFSDDIDDPHLLLARGAWLFATDDDPARAFHPLRRALLMFARARPGNVAQHMAATFTLGMLKMALGRHSDADSIFTASSRRTAAAESRSDSDRGAGFVALTFSRADAAHAAGWARLSIALTAAYRQQVPLQSLNKSFIRAATLLAEARRGAPREPIFALHSAMAEYWAGVSLLPAPELLTAIADSTHPQHDIIDTALRGTLALCRAANEVSSAAAATRGINMRRRGGGLQPPLWAYEDAATAHHYAARAHMLLGAPAAAATQQQRALSLSAISVPVLDVDLVQMPLSLSDLQPLLAPTVGPRFTDAVYGVASLSSFASPMRARDLISQTPSNRGAIGGGPSARHKYGTPPTPRTPPSRVPAGLGGASVDISLLASPNQSHAAATPPTRRTALGGPHRWARIEARAPAACHKCLEALPVAAVTTPISSPRCAAFECAQCGFRCHRECADAIADAPVCAVPDGGWFRPVAGDLVRIKGTAQVLCVRHIVPRADDVFATDVEVHPLAPGASNAITAMPSDFQTPVRKQQAGHSPQINNHVDPAMTPKVVLNASSASRQLLPLEVLAPAGATAASQMLNGDGVPCTHQFGGSWVTAESVMVLRAAWCDCCTAYIPAGTAVCCLECGTVAHKACAGLDEDAVIPGAAIDATPLCERIEEGTTGQPVDGGLSIGDF
jgi:hypothetical protein